MLASFLLKQLYIRAVDNISFDVKKAEVLGLVGESGCGKTTTGKLIIGLIEPTGGHVYFEGKDVFAIKKKAERMKLRREMQMIYQDPYKSLSPRLNVHDLISEPLKFHKIANTKAEIKEKVKQVLEITGLPTGKEFLSKNPPQLSGGQRQRVEIARRLIINPKLLVADEPTSMVDASVKGSLINLLLDLKEKLSLTLILITHDLSIAWQLCDRIAVMYLGKIVEIEDTEGVIKNPLHPYTKALISAVPTLDPETKCYLDIDKKISGMISTSSVDIPEGCRFYPRCNYRTEKCTKTEPELLNVGKDHKVACHLYN